MLLQALRVLRLLIALPIAAVWMIAIVVEALMESAATFLMQSAE